MFCLRGSQYIIPLYCFETDFFMEDFSLLSLRVAVFLGIFLKNDFLFIMFDPPAVRDFIVRVLD